MVKDTHVARHWYINKKKVMLKTCGINGKMKESEESELGVMMVT